MTEGKFPASYLCFLLYVSKCTHSRVVGLRLEGSLVCYYFDPFESYASWKVHVYCIPLDSLIRLMFGWSKNLSSTVVFDPTIRVTTHLENLEKSGNSKVVTGNGKSQCN